MPRVGVQDPARGSMCWGTTQVRAQCLLSFKQCGVVGGTGRSGSSWQCHQLRYWPGVGSSHGGRAPQQGVLSVPRGQAWVGAGAP